MIDPIAIASAAARIAVGEIGQGEEGGNNLGPYITKLGGRQGYLWCALFASWGYREEYRTLAPLEVMPSWPFRTPGVPEPGAKALHDALVRVGCGYRDPAKAIPGDLLLWRRDGGGHAAILEFTEHGLCHTVEGNVGAYPSKVRRLVHDVRLEPHFMGFATLRGRSLVG